MNLASRNSFLYQFTALNIFAIVVLIAAYFQGWLFQIYAADTSHIISIISITLLGGLVVSLIKAVGLNTLWNRLIDGDVSLIDRIRPRKIEGLGLELASKIQVIHHIAVVLLLMGISGTMIGIIIALKSTEAFAVGDQSSMVLAIVMLFKGVYVKFYASLVGIVGHMWILTNYHMLSSMSRRVLARMSDHVRSI
jgi:hypothetical protein